MLPSFLEWKQSGGLMLGKRKQQADTSPEVLEEDQYATADETRTLPTFAGERRIAIVWVSPVYDQFSTEAPASRPGKKG